MALEEGFWEGFASSPERRAQIEADKISFVWDELIEKFSFHAMTGVQHLISGVPLDDHTVVFRFMTSREPGHECSPRVSATL